MKWSPAIRGANRISTRWPAVAPLLILALLMIVVSLFIGAMHLSIGDVLSGLTGTAGDSGDARVVLTLRLPRVVLAVAVGAALSVSGASLQGLFRNPLADPGLIGVSSGAAVGAVAMILGEQRITHAIPVLAGLPLVPVAAFTGSLIAMVTTDRIANRRSGDAAGMLVLAGIAVTAIASAGIGLMVYLSDDRQLRDIVFWTMGSLATGGWQGVMLSAPFILAGLGLLLSIARPLDALLLGEREAVHLGVDVRGLRQRAMIGVALAVGAAVAVSGMIGFVGLIVPHLVRLSAGPGHRTLLPASALLGVALTLIADDVGRTIIAPSELPIGLVTSAVGGPFFLWLLLRRRASGS